MTAAPPIPVDHALGDRAGIDQGDALFRAAFEYASVGMAICNASVRWIKVNRALCAMTGYTAEELLATGYAGITHPEDMDDTCGVIRALVEGGEPAVQLEKRYIHRSGRVLWALVSVAAVRDASGAPSAFVTQVHDMTARIAAEHALRASVQRFQALAELAPVGIFQTDAAGRTVYVNRRLCEMSGLCPDGHMDHKWEQALHPEDCERTRREWDAAAAAGSEYHGSYRMVSPTGQVRWLLGAARPIRSEDGRVLSYLGTVTDVTALKAAEERLRQSLAAQQDLLTREAALLRELNHRVRNNLSSLLGLLKVYERSGKSGHETAAALRAMIRAMADVHELISRAPGGPVLLSDLVNRIVAGCAPAVVAEGPPVQIRATQAAALAMVLQELFTNSAKHGALSVAGGRVAVRWHTESGNQTVIDWLEDGGPAVREPTHRGVGLSLVEGFARGDLRGKVWFRFNPEGFACTLTFPFHHPSGPDHAPGPHTIEGS